MRSVVPTEILYYLSKVFGSKQFKEDITELRSAVEQCYWVKEELTWYVTHEWIFDTSTTTKMIDFIRSDPTEMAEFNIDISKMKWSDYARNYAYGVKHFLLNEEAVVPSMGYGDAVQKMEKTRGLWNWNAAGRPLLNLKSGDEMKKLILNTEQVKEAIAQIVSDKLKFYQGTL